MHHILFVCLGNICRSPMAEAIAKNIIKQQGLTAKFSVQSVATSPEEEGNPPYPEGRHWRLCTSMVLTLNTGHDQLLPLILTGQTRSSPWTMPTSLI